MVSIRCEKCDKKYKFKETAIGKNFDCKCGHQFVIEEVDEEIIENDNPRPSRKKNRNSSGTGRKPRKKRSRDSEMDEENSDESSEHQPKKSKELGREIDLSNTKICSKCKALVDISSVVCPKCQFNLMGLKYDEQHRKEITRDSTKVIYKYGKFLLPLILFLIVYFYAFLQKDKITELEAFEKVLYAKIQKIKDIDLKEKAAGSKKKDFIFHFGPNAALPHFIPVAKDGSDPMSIMGSGFFSFRTPGVCLRIGHTAKTKDVLTYYIKDPETGKPKEIKKSEYEFVPYNALAYFFFYDPFHLKP
ncbi:MAG: hypothetical protein COA79_23500 [Planctomycetota bacterium]|nr:MAG: hypothetical protein COA79_23500 [Planctomycetota bacterium]